MSRSSRPRRADAMRGLESERAFEHTERARVAVPHLDGVLADEAVPAEHLNTLVGHPHALRGRVGARVVTRLQRVVSLLELARGLPAEPAHRLGLDVHL